MPNSGPPAPTPPPLQEVGRPLHASVVEQVKAALARTCAWYMCVVVFPLGFLDIPRCLEIQYLQTPGVC